jgi:predicted ATPase
VLLTPVFGRAQAIHMLAARLSKHRFVTITGPGGGGKTTLAVSVAVTLASAYPQGICFVDLASVTEPRLVPGALASALGVAALSHLLPNILSFLSKKSVLLVLDNCEHVIEAAAQLAARVLNGARDVHILATSREPLQAAGESIYRLPPLEVPPAQLQAPRETLLDFPAIRLFTERAGMYSDSKLHDAELLLVANICRQLGGNPLAIEITAAYASLMGVRALAASLRNDHYLSINGLRTAVSRQRTLRATLDWSYDLLSPSQQLTFRRLSVFVGSFDLECAVAVVAEENQTVSEVLECLTDLTRKSLVIADTARQKALYRLPDLPRAFAREKLGLSGELAMINRRHAQMWCTMGAVEIQARVRLGTEWMSGFGQILEDLRADPLTSSQHIDMMGSLSEDLVSTDAIVRAEKGRGGWCTSEILRVKAERMLREKGLKAAPCAAAVLQTALETARQQGALSWELRTAMSLARLWRDQQAPRAAHDLLAAVYGRFSEGFETADLAAAWRLLQELAAVFEGSTDLTE